jgi:hypothetical protein
MTQRLAKIGGLGNAIGAEPESTLQSYLYEGMVMNISKRVMIASGLIFIILLIAGCVGGTAEPPATQTPSVKNTIAPTFTPTTPPTATPMPPIEEIIPPTAIPLPPTSPVETLPASVTVCESDCDFISIQAALDDPETREGAIIELQDPVHTEAGIVVQKNVTIRGQGVDGTIVQAHENPDDAPDRVFLVKKGTTVVLESMTIRHGVPAVQEENGGGIRNFGTLTLRHCNVSDNRANGGGGISNSGDLTLIDSTVSDNTADGIAPMGLECGNGGGIQCGSGALMLLNSTVSGNQGGFKGRARGGGLHIGCGCKAVTVNSTISGNRASRESGRTYNHGHSHGGGIYVAGELQLISSTISNNHADGEGGGIFVGRRLDYLYTIVANNTGKGGNCVIMGSDAEGSADRIGTNIGNLVEDGGCGAAYAGDPMLGSLADNGGATETHALKDGSPATDALPADHCYLSTDQRGLPRLASSGDGESLCDIGAFEIQP